MTDYRTAPGAAITLSERELLRSTAESIASEVATPTFVNIGVWWGAALWCMRVGAPNADLVGVDPKLYRWFGKNDKVADEENLHAALVDADSAVYGKVFEGDIHLLFIDGSHHASDVLADLDAWLPHIVPGGYVLLHDYSPSAYDFHFYPDLRGVRDAVQQWYTTHSREWKPRCTAGSIVSFQRRLVPLDHDEELPGVSDRVLASLVTVVLVNYKTKALTETAIRTFRTFYPTIEMILVDNHSEDASTTYIKSFKDKPTEHYKVILNTKNVGHGPAMHQGIAFATTPYVLTLDSDVEVLHGGFLEQMVKLLQDDPTLYATGWLRYVDRYSGVPHVWFTTPQPTTAPFIPYIHPYCGLYRLSTYKTLPSFMDHGAPCLDNMRVANEKSIKIRDFSLGNYLKHWEAGTRRLFHGDWHPSENTRPSGWNPNQRFPI